MRRTAWVYVLFVMLSALALSIVVLYERLPDDPPVWLFVGLTIAATLQRVFRVVAPSNKVYEASTISLFAGALLLPPWMFVLAVVIAHALEWAKERLQHTGNLRAWYIQPFNAAKCILSGLAAAFIAGLVPEMGQNSLSPEGLVGVWLAVVAYVMINQALLGLALWLARGVSFREAGIFRDALLVEAPLACIGYAVVEGLNRSPLSTVFVLAPIALIYQAFMLPKTQAEAMKALEKFNLDLTDANQAIRLLNDDLFLTLAKTFDMRDPYVAGHAAQVATYAVAVARELDLPPERIEMIRQCGYLHDIGKIAIPESILNKPSRLSEIEYEFMQKHSNIGADLIASSHGLRHLAPSIRHHHERWDGRGYPLHLTGQAIPLEARILNVCDSVEAMASDRPYHKAMKAAEIIAELKRCSGAQFDPVVVEAFVRTVEREGEQFLVNSARTVDSDLARSIWGEADLNRQFLKKVYAASTL